MNSRLSEVFNLPKESKEEMHEIRKDVAEQKAKAILDPETLDHHDDNMESYSIDAYRWAKDIMDLGMSVDPKHSAEMFNAAANMLKVAFESQNSKVDKRVKLYDLDLKRRKIEIEEQRTGILELPESNGKILGNRQDFLEDE